MTINIEFRIIKQEYYMILLYVCQTNTRIFLLIFSKNFARIFTVVKRGFLREKSLVTDRGKVYDLKRILYKLKAIKMPLRRG